MWGSEKNNTPILSPDQVKNLDKTLVIASIYYFDIYQQAMALGLSKSAVFIATNTAILSAEESQSLVNEHSAHMAWIDTYVADHLSEAINFSDDRAAHLTHAVNVAQNKGLVLEFGVYQGESLKIIQKAAGQTAYGFDSFTGLPEDWTLFHSKNFFNQNGATPQSNQDIHFIKGLFQDTLEAFIKTNPEPIRIAHLDADLYSSTSYVLTQLMPHLSTGTVLIFDDYLYALDYEKCDYRACRDFLVQTGFQVKFLSYERGSVALQLL